MYYFHLVTDEEWIKLTNRKKKEEVFQSIINTPEYLSFFPEGKTSQQIKNITEFYHEGSISEDHEFIYLTRDDIDGFVNHTVHLLCEIVSQRMNMGGLYV